MNIYILQIIAFNNTHIYAIITIIINNNHKYMFILHILCLKFYLFVYKQPIKSLFHFISIYIYIKADHFNKYFYKKIIICESL